MLRFDVINFFDKLIYHTKYDQNRSIFYNIQIFGLSYFDDMENAITNFWYFAKNKLIYQKSGPNNQAKAEHRALFSLELHISDAHCAAVFGPRPKLFD